MHLRTLKKSLVFTYPCEATRNAPRALVETCLSYYSALLYERVSWKLLPLALEALARRSTMAPLYIE